MKTNVFIIIYFLLIALICLIGLDFFQSNNQFEKYKVPSHYKEVCEYYFDNSIEENAKFQYKKMTYSFNDEQCNYIVNNYDKTGSFFLFYNKIITNSFFNWIFHLFAPMIVILPVIFELSKEFKAGYIAQFLQRKTYKEYIFHLFKTSYKWFYSIFLILLFIACCALWQCEGNFDPMMDIYNNHLGTECLFFLGNFVNCIIYFLVILFNILMYINICIILILYLKSFFATFFVSGITIYIFNFITYGFAEFITGVPGESISMFSIYTWTNVVNPWVYLLFAFMYYLITLFVLYLNYKNKEKVIGLHEV